MLITQHSNRGGREDDHVERNDQPALHIHDKVVFLLGFSGGPGLRSFSCTWAWTNSRHRSGPCSRRLCLRRCGCRRRRLRRSRRLRAGAGRTRGRCLSHLSTCARRRWWRFCRLRTGRWTRRHDGSGGRITSDIDGPLNLAILRTADAGQDQAYRLGDHSAPVVRHQKDRRQ